MIDYKRTKKECKSMGCENSGLLKRLLYTFNILYGFKNVIFLHWFIFFNFVN